MHEASFHVKKEREKGSDRGISLELVHIIKSACLQHSKAQDYDLNQSISDDSRLLLH
jgi:hypothetical protein